MNTRHHARTGSSGRKLAPAHTRTTRPQGLTKRTVSYQNQLGPVSPRLTARSTYAPKSTETQSDDDYELHEDDVMASFLQFCTTCERQIVTPNSTMLYCSEACRRKDSIQSTPYHIHHSPPLNPFASYHDAPPMTIVPQRSPTVLQPLSTRPSELSLSDVESLSPTECGAGCRWSDPNLRKSSRPRLSRASRTDDSNNLPSLVHSPSSSYGTIASYTSSSRPLPRKHSHPVTRSVDLVTPDFSASTANTASDNTASIESSTSTLVPVVALPRKDGLLHDALPDQKQSDRRKSYQGKATESLKSLMNVSPKNR